MKKTFIYAGLSILISCAHLTAEQRAYSQVNGEAVVYLELTTCAVNNPDLSATVAAVAQSLLALRTEYIIKKTTPLSYCNHNAVLGCSPNTDGILSLTVSNHRNDGKASSIKIDASLRQCPIRSPAAEIWHTSCHYRSRNDETSLSTVIAQTQKSINPLLAVSTAAVFNCTQDLLRHIPNPVLNAKQIDEKMEIDENFD